MVFWVSSEFSRGFMKVPHNKIPVDDKFGKILYDNLINTITLMNLSMQTSGSETSSRE